MQIPLQVTFSDMEPSPALEERVRVKAAKLEQFFDRLISCHVVIEAPHRRRHKGRRYVVRIHLRVPGREIDVSRNADDPTHEDVYVAVRDAFAAATRQLEEHARQQRGEVKLHAREAR
jgi:ribosomal subunit interface protein